MSRRKDRLAVIRRGESKQNGVDQSLFLENTAAVKAVTTKTGFIEMHSAEDRHLVEEMIDDVNAVDEFEMEATKVMPVQGGVPSRQLFDHQ